VYTLFIVMCAALLSLRRPRGVAVLPAWGRRGHDRARHRERHAHTWWASAATLPAAAGSRRERGCRRRVDRPDAPS